MSSLNTMDSPSLLVALQTHLYSSFLEAKAADVILHVRGTWEAAYSLHRVVLIRAEFFNSLLTAGFAESSTSTTSSRNLQEIDIIFDDPNITRAAFEVCLARLYGGGPPLCIPPSLIPTPTHPLTPGFPTLAPKHDAPPGHHPVTTRFLLSLLATSIYLSIPSTAVEALKCILSSIGPHTVIEYLDFAIGKPIRTQGAAEPDTAVGLENVAQEVKREHSPSVDSTKTEVVDPDSHSTIGGGLLETLSHRYPSCPDECTLHEHSFYYGPISSKIGEAAACWLAKWGPDILKIEEKGLNAQPRPTSAGGSFNVTVPEIWGRGGLSAKWVCALVSSDLLFIRGERERYEFAKSIVEFRRQGGLDDAEEDEWTKMFDQGIYYSNMLVEDVVTISQEISPTTGKPYVPLSVLQAGIWHHSVLRHRILSSSALGITETTADILGRLNSLNHVNHEREATRRYFSIPVDSFSRLGDHGIETTSMDQLFESSSHAPSSELFNMSRTTSETNFFGLVPEPMIASSCVLVDKTGKVHWSPYPPLRFAVEFSDLDSLKEKPCLYSHTVWYAGSLFNVRVQIVRKKGEQLGIYLHRQSSTQNSSQPSTPMSHSSLSIISPQSRSTTSTSDPAANPDLNTVPAPPMHPYRDPRGTVSAYFAISCASATGSSLARFVGAPRTFTGHNNWGCGSTSLTMEEYLKVEEESVSDIQAIRHDVSLRATVVLGII